MKKATEFLASSIGRIIQAVIGLSVVLMAALALDQTPLWLKPNPLLLIKVGYALPI